jgi:hypothetical protein
MSTAIRSTQTRKNMMEAQHWLQSQGYDCVCGNWMKKRSFATLQRLPSGRVSISEGVIVPYRGASC